MSGEINISICLFGLVWEVREELRENTKGRKGGKKKEKKKKKTNDSSHPLLDAQTILS